MFILLVESWEHGINIFALKDDREKELSKRKETCGEKSLPVKKFEEAWSYVAEEGIREGFSIYLYAVAKKLEDNLTEEESDGDQCAQRVLKYRIIPLLIESFPKKLSTKLSNQL